MTNLYDIYNSSRQVIDMFDESKWITALQDGISFRYEPGNCTGYDVTVVLIGQKLLVAVPNFSACGWFGWGDVLYA